MNKTQYSWQKYIRRIPDFPKKGIMFYDLLPVLADKNAFKLLIDDIIKLIPEDIDYVAGPGARGFILGSVIAYKKNAGFVPIRKKNKLPGEIYTASYSLEYGEDTLEISKHNFLEKRKVNILLIDDLSATGNTLIACKKLIEQFSNTNIVGIFTILNIKKLNSINLFKKNKIAYNNLLYI